MSEVMDQAVIGMPYEMALGCEVSRRQYYSRANAVLAERDALAAKLAMLEDAAAREMLLASNAAEWRWRSRNFALN
ncbi:hypothetical protein P4200_17095 [Pseudomonas aeruginosa]|nr:hypothetical protein [Pseudomonas aeruginosa]